MVAISFPFPLSIREKTNEVVELEENFMILSAELFSYKGET